ncbi:MAG: SLBB domain-containing protein [Planctomycetes bacterium]|nr:SLBB domain-containing protein [Planctomycetota bacterium]
MRRSMGTLGLVLLGPLGCRTISPEEFDRLHKIQTAMLEAQKDYVVQPGDTVLVTVYRGGAVPPEYRQEVAVQPDGKIGLVNLSAPVDTKGMTVAALQARIKELYAAFFRTVGDPAAGQFEVTVQFLTSTKAAWLPDQVFVTGQVRRPKSVTYRRGLTVMKAVSEAEGWIYAANESRTVLLRRGTEGQSVAREIDLAAVALHEAEDIELMPGDVVFVPLSTIARINLWVEFYVRGIIPINPSILRTFVAL